MNTRLKTVRSAAALMCVRARGEPQIDVSRARRTPRAPCSSGRTCGLARGSNQLSSIVEPEISGAAVSLRDSLGLVGVSSDAAIAFPATTEGNELMTEIIKLADEIVDTDFVADLISERPICPRFSTGAG